jgi:hypothetical protein
MHRVVQAWVYNLCVLVILFVWAGSYIVGWVNHDYSPPPALHWVMMALAGALFGSRMLKDGKNGGGGPPEPHP